MLQESRIVKLVSGKYAVQKMGNYGHWFIVARFDSLPEARYYRETEFADEVAEVIS